MQAKFPPFTVQAVSDAPPAPAHEVSPVEAKLRTALQYIYHARLLIDEALDVVNPPEPVSQAEVMLQRLDATDDDTAAA